MSFTFRRSWPVIVAIVVSFGGGVVTGLHRLENTRWAALSSFAYRWTAARGEYEHATPRALGLLEPYVRRAASAPAAIASFVMPSRVLALAMLANLHERNGNAVAANAAWVLAAQTCAAATWTDCTKAHLAAVIRKKPAVR